MNTQMKKRRNYFKHFKMILQNEFHGYNGGGLIKDLLAGMTVGAVSLPLALAFGAASVNPENAAIGIAAGLITAIIAGIITGLLGGGSFQISGPTGAMTVVLTGIVGGTYGLTGMFLACFLAGIIMFLAGILHIGKLIAFIPRPVVTGFTSGIAVIIALGQLGNFFGVTLSGESATEKVIDFFTNKLGDINLTALICSIAVVLVMVLFPKKLSRFVPGSLVAIIVITVISAVAKLDIAVIGKIPTSLVNSSSLQFTDITPEMFGGVIGAAVTIAALGMIESLLCGTCAANMKKEKFDSNVELVAQGIGNIIVPFFGGVPSTAAIARTSVAINSGGKTRLTSCFQSLFLLACMFIFSGAIGFVPYAALAGVLVMTAIRMNDWKSIRYYFKNKLWEAVCMFFITMLATVFLDLTYAILIGVAISMLMLVVRLTRIEIEHSPVEPSDGTRSSNSVTSLELTQHSSSVIIYSSGAMFFANTKELPKYVERMEQSYDEYIFSFHGIIYIDVTSVDTLTEMVRQLKSSGKSVAFTGVSSSVMELLVKTGFVAEVGAERFFSSVDKVIAER